jgi:hypothetical protein
MGAKEFFKKLHRFRYTPRKQRGNPLTYKRVRYPLHEGHS